MCFDWEKYHYIISTVKKRQFKKFYEKRYNWIVRHFDVQ